MLFVGMARDVAPSGSAKRQGSDHSTIFVEAVVVLLQVHTLHCVASFSCLIGGCHVVAFRILAVLRL